MPKYKVPVILLCSEDLVGLNRCSRTGEPLWAQVSHTFETDNERGDKGALILFRPRQKIIEFTRRQAINDSKIRESV